MLDNGLGYDKTLLVDIIKTPMPFGKYKGTLICNLPIAYLEWFKRKSFPNNRLGLLLETCLEIKMNGLEGILIELRKIIH